MDAIQLIERDHRTVEQLFQRLERALRDGAHGLQRRLVRDVTRELSVHATIEEQFVYPALREAGVRDEVLDALEEHHAVKVTLSELEATSTADERFAAKVRLLVASVREHVEEEERETLPALRRALDGRQLRELGDTLDRARRVAPTRPHPASPDTPPGNLVAGAVAAVVDRSRDAVAGGAEVLRMVAVRGAERGSDAARDLARRALGRSRGAVGDARRRGRSVVGALVDEARDTAEDVADIGGEALGDVRQRGREAIDAIAERSEQGARRVQEGSRTAAREVRQQGRAAVRGYEGEAQRAPARRPRRARGTKARASRGKAQRGRG